MARQSQDVVVRFVADTGDMSKGMDNMQGRFRAMTSSLEGIAKLGAAVAAVKFFTHAIDEAREAARVTRQTEAVLKSTGEAAHVTAGHVDDLASRMSELAGVDDELVAHGENVLLTFTRVRNEIGKGNDVFDQATQLALDMTTALSSSGIAGDDLQGSVTRIGKALQDPVKGMAALAKVGVTFTAGQKDQIAALVESGDLLGAQKIILGELKTEFGGMAAASADGGDKLKVAWDNLAEDVGTKLMPAFNTVSTWLVGTGAPAVGRFADAAGDVLSPALHTAAAAGKGLVGVWEGLPGPIQAGVIAMAAWAVVGRRVEAGASTVTSNIRALGEEMKLQASLGSMGGDGVGKFSAAVATLEARVPLLGAMSMSFQNARAGADGFGASLKGVAAAAATGLKAGLSGLVNVLGGPWGIAITGATVVLGYFMAKSQQAEARQREFADAGRAVAQAMREQNGVIDENIRKTAAKALEDKNLLQPAKDLGIALPHLTDALLGQGDAADEVRGQLSSLVDINKIYATTETNPNELTWTGALEEQGLKAQHLLDDMNALIGAKNNDNVATQRQIEAASQSAEAQKGMTAAQDSNLSSTDLLKAAVEDLGGKFDDTKTDGQHLVDVIKGLTNAQTEAIDLEEGYEAALDSLTASIKDNGTTLDIHTEKGRANRDSVEAAAKSIRDMAQADLESGVPATEAIKRHDERAAALQREADKLGLSKTETAKLIEAYGGIPKTVRTIIEAQGYEETLAKLNSLSAHQALLQQGIPVTPGNLTAWKFRNGAATGGLITGPGGPRSDSIPMMLSNREYVQNADAVAHYGVPFMNAINKKMLPKMADGGLVWPFPVDTRKTKIPEMPVFSGSIGGAGVQRWAPMVLQALALLGQSGALLPNVLRRMNQESGGNPNAINLWDSNAMAGHPSKGLMQTIPGTFAAYAGPFAGRGIFDPFANIYAGLNYAIHRYGSLQYAMDKPGGYRNGGWLNPGKLGYNETSQPEAVLTRNQLNAMARGGTSVTLNVGVIGNQRDLDNMLTKAFDRLKSQGRV